MYVWRPYWNEGGREGGWQEKNNKGRKGCAGKMKHCEHISNHIDIPSDCAFVTISVDLYSTSLYSCVTKLVCITQLLPI